MYQSEPTIASQLAALHRDRLLADAQRPRPRSTGRGRFVVAVRMPSVRGWVGAALVRAGQRLAGAPAA